MKISKYIVLLKSGKTLDVMAMSLKEAIIKGTAICYNEGLNADIESVTTEDGSKYGGIAVTFTCKKVA